ncbi:Nucleoredoxin [Globisporangium polare]
MANWTELFGEELLTKDGVQPTTKVLADKKLVGIYFSAHWCPPCRGFTPTLSTTYEELKEEHPEVEIVFVSSDRDIAGFDKYYGEMPFVALPYAEHELKKQLGSKYGVSGIPTLVFLNEHGQIITEDGRSMVVNVQGDVEDLWLQLTARA